METVNYFTLLSFFDREDTSTYFLYSESKKIPFDGPSHLVGREISKTDPVHENIGEDSILLHLLLTIFVVKLPKD